MGLHISIDPLLRTHQPKFIEGKRNSWRSLVRFVPCLILTSSATAAADESNAPPKRPFFLPDVEIDADSGAANGDAIIGRLLPTFSLPINDRWQLTNLTVITIADAPGRAAGTPGNPEPVQGPHVFGLGDLTTVALLTPKLSHRLKWGIGAIFGIPIATDPSLGSGKWSTGPAIRLAYQSGRWRFGLLASNLKSFSGDTDRADINQLLVRGSIRRELGTDWFFVYNPIITANWDAASDQRWLIPLGGGFGKYFNFGSSRVGISMQAYSNVTKPDGAPDHVLRVSPGW